MRSSPSPTEAVTAADVLAARPAVEEVARRTPILSTRTFSERAGGTVALKAENLQRTGSFKVRGVASKLAALGEDGCANGVVAASAGNHAQALAAGAAARGGRERLAVVAGARRDDAVVARVAQRGQLRRHAADLEGAGALQVLGLEHDRPTRALGERAGGEDRRPAGDGLDRRSCGCYVARGDHRQSAMMASISTSAPIGSAATPIVVRAGGSDGK